MANLPTTAAPGVDSVLDSPTLRGGRERGASAVGNDADTGAAVTVWELAGRMSDTTLQRLLDDLQKVPLLPEPLIEAYADGRWLQGPCCARCGIQRDRCRAGCVCCQNRHEKRRQRGGCEPAALIGTARVGTRS